MKDAVRELGLKEPFKGTVSAYIHEYINKKLETQSVIKEERGRNREHVC